MSNPGFFSSSVIATPIKQKPLPPVLDIIFPETEAKKSKVVEIPKSKLTQYIFDIEVYTNYFLVKFLNVLTDEIIDFELTEGCPLDCKRIEHILATSEIIGFNSTKYDILMLRLALENASNKQLKQASDLLIQSDIREYQFVEKYKLPKLKVKHIDLIELMFGIASLKMYGARLHSKKLQDLPIEPDAILTDEQMDQICEYCNNDVLVTKMAFLEKIQQIELRRTMSKKYKLDLLSKSDAQIAEAVLKAELEDILDKEIKKPDVVKKQFHYKVPDFIKFNSPILNDALEIVTTKLFSTRSNGVIEMPKELTDLKVSLGKSVYRMGMGGLHSTEKSVFHVADETYSLFDFDVGSYYPAIIIQCGLYPKHLGKEFLTVYKEIVDERLEAKKTGDKVKAESLKIVVNGSFGKLGQPYSTLYAPELMVQVTVTGQLSLLMLIEMLESKGIPVVSGNTDGIVMKCPKTHEDTMRNIIKRWEKITGFEMESTQYLGLFSRDINNYLAIKLDGTVKAKGTFASSNIAKNPENDICTDAMIAYIKYGTPFMQTIKSCYDITKFLTVRRVNGGAVKVKDCDLDRYNKLISELVKKYDGYNGPSYARLRDEIASCRAVNISPTDFAKFEEILDIFDHADVVGKTIRFYHSSKVRGVISYQTNGNKVPNSDSCRPVMDLPDKLPDDIDYQYYADYCHKMF
jgi:hypothetical protein